VSHVFIGIKDSIKMDKTGEEIYLNWSEIDEETQRQLKELAIEAEELLNKGVSLIM